LQNVDSQAVGKEWCWLHFSLSARSGRILYGPTYT
jgi:hypothetical protein